MLQAQQFGKRLRNTAEYSDPSKLDATKLKKIPANCMATIPASFLKKLPCSAISGSLTELSATTFKSKAQVGCLYAFIQLVCLFNKLSFNKRN